MTDAHATTRLAVRIRGLRKAYGDLMAVRGIDLDVGRGEVVALLGPNGAGKTTTLEILEGHRSRSAGEVSVLGADPASAIRRSSHASASASRPRESSAT